MNNRGLSIELPLEPMEYNRSDWSLQPRCYCGILNCCDETKLANSNTGPSLAIQLIDDAHGLRYHRFHNPKNIRSLTERTPEKALSRLFYVLLRVSDILSQPLLWTDISIMIKNMLSRATLNFVCYRNCLNVPLGT